MLFRSKKQYQEWVEHHFPKELAKEVNDAWTEHFEKFVQQLMNTKFKEGDDEQDI